MQALAPQGCGQQHHQLLSLLQQHLLLLLLLLLCCSVPRHTRHCSCPHRTFSSAVRKGRVLSRSYRLAKKYCRIMYAALGVSHHTCIGQTCGHCSPSSASLLGTSMRRWRARQRPQLAAQLLGAAAGWHASQQLPRAMAHCCAPDRRQLLLVGRQRGRVLALVKHLPNEVHACISDIRAAACQLRGISCCCYCLGQQCPAAQLHCCMQPPCAWSVCCAHLDHHEAAIVVQAQQRLEEAAAACMPAPAAASEGCLDPC